MPIVSCGFGEHLCLRDGPGSHRALYDDTKDGRGVEGDVRGRLQISRFRRREVWPDEARRFTREKRFDAGRR